eukprot:CAMPEP_0202904494 /NCGR_PEP_ID=MMETSP1392-20130828/29654_1 /ASSEMBLY_ACC=CAM_ASM_000868 /TAXON_ID=225041 /ORGANISM="Chlamydomonas chlamydogama, Strain SAG 11-48b" /LENGTH=338 /DNA_ID=CAMNT_0049592139 /DNA_START=42 /DNA_END=1055 /DNA_ORIENTATION=+
MTEKQLASVDLKDREHAAEYRAPRANLSLRDFDIIGRLGDGSFSTVILAQRKGSSQQNAIKIVNKHLVLRNKMVEYIKSERNIMDRLDNDGIVKLQFTFQDADSLYFGLEYCPGGDLYEQINKQGKLSLEDARFYAAEVVLILDYLRSKEVVHRDLKPENLLLSGEGHLKLVDFGSAKAFFLPAPSEKSSSTKARATSFVGTAEYVSPEVLRNLPLSYPADLWALGCIVFQMLAGRPPFKAGSEYLTFQKVSERDFSFPDDFPPHARDLVDRLLALEPDDRLGAADMEDLKRHDFFAGVRWEELRSQKAPDFIAPSPPTPEEEALDWELTSLVAGPGG